MYVTLPHGEGSAEVCVCLQKLVCNRGRVCASHQGAVIGKELNPILCTFIAGLSGLSFGCSAAPKPIEDIGCATDLLVARPSARLILSDSVVARLKERAALNHRSLQGELLAILESVEPPRRSIKDIYEMVKASGVKTPSESAKMIREDRDDPRR